MRIRHVPRPADDTLLSMLAMRHEGISATEIARRFGIAQQEVSRRTNEVRAADVAQASSDAEACEIAGAYW